MQVVARHRGSPLRMTLGLDALALAALAAAVVLIELRDGSQGVVATVLAGLAFTVAIGAGALAARALAREPLRTRTGRWALGLAVVFTASFPAFGVITAILGLEEGWAEPLMPAQFALALVAAVLGLAAREPERRGALLVPLLLGVTALMFVVVDLLFPY